jgi:hypothetical protein
MVDNIGVAREKYCWKMYNLFVITLETDRKEILTEILLKVALNTINPYSLIPKLKIMCCYRLHLHVRE